MMFAAEKGILMVKLVYFIKWPCIRLHLPHFWTCAAQLKVNKQE